MTQTTIPEMTQTTIPETIMQTEELQCAASGTSHQGATKFRGNNAQCVAMSACAAAYSVFKERDIFTTEDIDTILQSGDSLYSELKPFLPVGEIFLNPEELPTEIRVRDCLAVIEPLSDNWLNNGLFPTCPEDRDAKLLSLQLMLGQILNNAEYNDITDSIIFTGQSYTVSFWRHLNNYFLFNSHAVDARGRPTASEFGRARFFKCNSLSTLAKLLFARHVNDGTQYSIHKISVINTNLSVFGNRTRTTTTANSVPIQRDPRLTIQKPVVVINRVADFKLEVLVPVVSLKRNFSVLPVDEIEEPQVKRGRPKKVKRGVKPTKQNAHLEAVLKYNVKNPHVNREAVRRYAQTKPEINRDAVKNYTQKNPEVHRGAVKNYTQKHPEVHRDAVRNYTQKNPEVHRDAAKKYSQNHPQVNRDAVQNYTLSNPDVHRDSVRRYSEQHPDVNKKAVDKYNKQNRSKAAQLSKISTLTGQFRDLELDEITPFCLKKPSLLSPDTFVCPHCRARLFQEERGRVKWCCGSNSFNVQNFAPLTEDFYSSPAFVERPRAYNNFFSFSALGVSHGYQQPAGLSFLKIQGRIYHRVFDLAYDKTDNNLTSYINDPYEREQRALGKGLNTTVTLSISRFLHEVNPYIKCFKLLSQEPSDDAFIKFERTTRATHGNILGDLPIGDEIAAIISTDREPFSRRCIAVWKVGDKKPHTVDIMHDLYESFQYPLLYPEGNSGWYPDKLDKIGNKLTQVKYVRCLLLSERRFSEIGRLSEEWLVDMYCRISEERLRYMNSLQNQSSATAFRTAPIEEVQRSVAIANDETIQGEGFVPGKVYLPNTFTGGPRYMKVKYMDAIALVNRLGTPTYFLTFTCNPKWPEIHESIPRGQKVNPLICARAFNLRLTQLLRDIRGGHWFGKIDYMMHVIEFQKRGLPHAHICIRIHGGGPVQNVDIDKIVRADIPAATEAQGKLRKAVLDHMIHGPCGPPYRTNLPCWDSVKSKCSKFFPKRATDTTFCDDRGFVNLRRDINNTATIKYRSRDVPVNDLWVVPYNAALLLKYDAHINLEVASQRTIVKYLFKYMTKGPDESRVAVVADSHKNNEIEQYVTKRYIGSSDAAWRTLEFDVTAREPTVKQLAVHLDNQQSVYFKPGAEAEAATRNTSDLITYFNRPVGDEFDRLSYLDFYEKYIIHNKQPKSVSFPTTNGKFVTKRQRGELVARLFWVGPNRGEQFYLRLLLNSYPCRSYSDLLNLGGPNCNTFQDAAKFVGLADDEVEYETAMSEASTFFTGPRLRRFFVLLALNSAPVASLWGTYQNQLCEDFLNRLPNDRDRAVTLGLVEINRMLQKHGSSVEQCGLPAVVDDTTELGRELDGYNFSSLKSFVAEWLPKLSSEQRAIYDYVDDLCMGGTSRDTAIFIDGPAGTGKTLLLNVIAAHVRADIKGVVLCTATSAIAAQNYDGGTTAHTMFRLPLNLVDDLGYWGITNGSQRAHLISNSKVIIYDEAPMAHKYYIHLLDRSLRDLMQSDVIFGGKVIIFAGDFRQIPPVVPYANNNSDIFLASLKSSPMWQKLKSFSLMTSQRSKEDVDFATFLLKLGSNQLASLSLSSAAGNARDLIDLSSIPFVTELDPLIDFVFPADVIDDSDVCAHRAILTTRNDAAREINDIILSRLRGPLLHFYSIDRVDCENTDEIFLGPDTLNRLQPQGVPEHDLQLKESALCMITRNLSFADGLVNGTKVIIVRVSPRLIAVRKPGGSEEYLIPRILFKAPIDPRSPLEMFRRQFPLQNCYAMTVHKSQGQTISRVGVDLRSDVFSHGQLYVALGRVRNSKSIKILIHKDRLINGKPHAKNIIIDQLIKKK